MASLSLDLDNQWSYMKIHGDSGWETFPSYLDVFIPHILDALDDLDLKITFFIVGQDAVLEKNHKALQLIITHGHEIGNHSYAHESWLHLYPKDKIETEIENAEEAIYQVTGQRPVGFRGPGFSWSRDLLAVLAQRGYLYDASSLPTFIGPLARLYYFWTSNLSKDERKERKKLFGTLKDGLMPLKPYLVQIRRESRLLEIPVSTIPVFKVPFHLSYLLYLSGYSELLMKRYLDLAMLMCQITRTNPSFLLHPLDLIGGDQIKDLAFFPGMNISTIRKLQIFKSVINKLSNSFNFVTMSVYAKSFLKGDDIATRLL